MKLFDRSKSVIGIFDNDAAVDAVVRALYDKGYGKESDDEISIIDQARLDQEMPAKLGQQASSPPGGTANRMGPVVDLPTSDQGENAPSVGDRRNIKSALTSAGIDDTEAEFYAQRILHGAKLVIANVDPEDVDEIEALFDEQGRAQATDS